MQNCSMPGAFRVAGSSSHARQIDLVLPWDRKGRTSPAKIRQGCDMMWSDAWFVVPSAVWSLFSILVMFRFVIRVGLVQTADDILSLCLPCSASLCVFEGWSERCGSGKLFTLTPCHMKLMALLFGEHAEAMDSHIVTSVVRQRIAFSKRIWRLESKDSFRVRSDCRTIFRRL